MSKEPKFSPTTERLWDQIPEVLRDADSDQVFPEEIKEVKEVFNYIINSSAEEAGPGSEVGRNLYPDPSFEFPSAKKVLQTTNVVLNPSGVLIEGETVVRRNLAYASNVVAENNASIIPNSFWNTSNDWWRVMSSSNGAGVIVRTELPYLASGEIYTVSAEVANPNPTSITIAVRWGQGEPVLHTIAPGTAKIVSATGSELVYFDHRRGGVFSSSEGGDFMIRRPIIEGAGMYLPFFDGNRPLSDPDLTTQWEGVAGESPTKAVAPRPKGWSATNGAVYWSVTKQKVLLFAPYIGNATAHAQAAPLAEGVGRQFNAVPVPTMAMAKVVSNEPQWVSSYDGAYPKPLPKQPIDNEVSNLQYPVLNGGTVPPEAITLLGAYWVSESNTVYRKVK